MASIRQKKLARATVANLEADEPLNKEKLVASVGYSTKVAEHKAKEILQSKGVQEELKILGFDSDTAKSVVGEILIAGDSDLSRLAAAREIFKVNGDYAPDKSISVNISEELTDKQKEYVQRLHSLKGGHTGS